MSFKWSAELPGDVQAGNLLHPDLELTYEQFRAMKFDPEATLLLAMEPET